MRKLFVWSAMCISCMSAMAESGAFFVHPVNVECQKKSVMIVRESINVLSGFSDVASSQWLAPRNYENRLSFKMVEDGGRRMLQITNRREEKSDTAWQLVSTPRPVTPGATWSCKIVARGTVSMDRPRGHKGNWESKLVWMNSSGRIIGQRYIGFEVSPKTYAVTRLSGKVPENATRVVLTLGADSPNISPHDVLTLSSLDLSEKSDVTGFEKTASFELYPQHISGNAVLAWDARVPAGAHVAFQVAAGASRRGPWSAFTGPDGTEKSVYDASGVSLSRAKGKWVKVKVLLLSDGKVSPEVRSVTVDGLRYGDWCGEDHQSPVLTIKSETLTGNSFAPIRFTLRDNHEPDPASLRFLVDGKDETSRLKAVGELFEYIPSAPYDGSVTPEKSNVHSFRVSAADIAGNIVDETHFFLIGERQTKNIVTQRDDGCVLIDNKPFFPIGLYAVSKREFNSNSLDRAFSELKAGGFNTAHTYNTRRGPEFTEFLDTARKYGFKVFVPSNGGANAMNILSFLKDAARERLHPAILAWYLADDTSSHVSPKNLSNLSKALHAIDPAHITVQADPVGTAPYSRYIDYVNATDGFLPEIYPVHSHGVDGVPVVIEDMKLLYSDIAAVGTSPKTVWPIIQYFDGWGWTGFPTFAELRAMSYLAVIHGANGITWYTYGGFNKNRGVTDTPERWRNICTVATELHALQDVLTERAVPQPAAPEILSGPKKDSLGHPSIGSLLKIHNGKKYLLTANSAKQTVRARFAVSGSQGDVMFENRRISFTGNTFEDEFAPYAVHVYEMTPGDAPVCDE